MIMAVSLWYLVAWKTYFNVRNNFQEKDLCFCPYLTLIVVEVRFVGQIQVNLG